MKQRSVSPVLLAVLVLSACASPTVTPDRSSTAITLAPTVAATTPGRVAGVPVPAPAPVPACPADIHTPLFNTIPIDPNDFLAFRPLGFLSTPIHMFPAKHSAFSMTLPGATPVKKPVKAPGKVWVVDIWEASFSTGGGNYQVFVYPCREFRVYFGHIATISEKLLNEFKNPNRNAIRFRMAPRP